MRGLLVLTRCVVERGVESGACLFLPRCTHHRRVARHRPRHRARTRRPRHASRRRSITRATKKPRSTRRPPAAKPRGTIATHLRVEIIQGDISLAADRERMIAFRGRRTLAVSICWSTTRASPRTCAQTCSKPPRRAFDRLIGINLKGAVFPHPTRRARLMMKGAVGSRVARARWSTSRASLPSPPARTVATTASPRPGCP